MERDQPLQRVHLVHRLMFNAAGMDCRCCFLSPLTTKGTEELLRSFNCQLLNTKKPPLNLQPQKRTIKNSLYLKKHHALHKIKLLQKRGEKGVC